MSNVGQILNEYLNFRCHLSTFRAENTLKSGTLQTENMPKHFLNHFEKAQITTFSTAKLPKMTLSNVKNGSTESQNVETIKKIN